MPRLAGARRDEGDWRRLEEDQERSSGSEQEEEGEHKRDERAGARAHARGASPAEPEEELEPLESEERLIALPQRGKRGLRARPLSRSLGASSRASSDSGSAWEDGNKVMSESLQEALSFGEGVDALRGFSVAELRFSADLDGRSPLQVALLCDNLAMARAVLELALAKPLTARRAREASLLRASSLELARADHTQAPHGASARAAREAEVERLLAPAAESLFLSLLGRPDNNGWTAMHYAAQAAPGAMRLVLSFAPGSMPGHGQGHGHSQAVLSGRAALASAADSTGCSPLHVAAASGNVEAISSLLLWRAEPHPANLDRDTPLDLAANRAVRRALSHGVTEELVQGAPKAFRALGTLLLCGESVDERKGLLQQTVLHRACEVGRADLVRFLVHEAGADVGAADACGWTPLHYCAKHCSSGHRAAADMLLRRGARAGAASANGLQPLHLAAAAAAGASGDAVARAGADAAAMVALLARCGAGLDARERSAGLTPLMVAARKGGAGGAHAALELVLSGCDLYACDARGWTALHTACSFGNRAVLRLLAYCDAEKHGLRRVRSRAGKLPGDLCPDPVLRAELWTPWELAAAGRIDGLRQVHRDLRAPVALEDGRSSATGGNNEDGDGGGSSWSSSFARGGFWLQGLGMNEHSFGQGLTLLHAAVLGDHFGPSLQSKPKPRSRSEPAASKGASRAQQGLTGARQHSEEAVVAYLLSLSQVWVDSSDKRGMTPLMHAARLGKLKIAALLLSKGADVRMADLAGNTAAHWASAYGRARMLNQLEAAPGGKEAAETRNHGGYTSLEVAGEPALLGVSALPPRRKNSPPKVDLAIAAVPHPDESKSSEDEEPAGHDAGRARDNEPDDQVLKRLRDVARELQTEEGRLGKGPHCVSDMDARRALMDAAAEISWERGEWQDRDDALKALRVAASAVERDERRLQEKQPPQSRPPSGGRPPSGRPAGRFAKDNSSVSSSSKSSVSSGCCSSCCSCSSGCCTCSCSSCCSSREGSRRGTLDSYSGSETGGSSSSNSSTTCGSRRGTMDSATTSSSDDSSRSSSSGGESGGSGV